MNPKTSGTNESKQGRKEGMLEKLAKILDPIGRDISDAELSDPGANIHDDTEERPARKAPPDTTRQK